MKIEALALMAMACVGTGLRAQTNTMPLPNYETLVQQSTDCDGAIAGLNAKGQIFAWNGKKWRQVEGELKQISVGSKSEVWGVNSLDRVWKLTATGWQQMPGRMLHISVSKGGKVVVAIDDAGQPYSWDPTPDASGSGTWKPFVEPSTPVQQPALVQQPTLVKIEAGTGTIYGLGRQNEVYKWIPKMQGWLQLDGALETISVGCDDSIGGVNKGNAWVRTDADIANEVQTPTAPANWIPVVQSAQDLTIIDRQTSLILNPQNLVIQHDTSVMTLDAQLKMTPIYNTTPIVVGKSTNSPYVCADSQIAMTGLLKLDVNLPDYNPPDHICLSFIGGGVFKAIPQPPAVGSNGTVVRGLSALLPDITPDTQSQSATGTISLAEAVAAAAKNGLEYVARPAKALGPVACDPRTFHNVSNHSWVDFRLPAGLEGQRISIPKGDYNHYVVPACNQVWWDGSCLLM